MNCDDVRTRTVAWQDGELSRSETVQVEEHLARCVSCASLAQRLAAATPRPFLRPPPEVLHQLHAALDVDVLLSKAATPEPARVHRTLSRWWREPTEVSRGALFAYAALLAATVAWAVGASWTSSQAHPPPHAIGASEIPSDHYRPASYSSDRTQSLDEDAE